MTVKSSKQTNEKPISQEKPSFRANLPAWIQQFPRLRFPSPDPNFQLISMAELDDLLKSADPTAAARIKEDIVFLDYELLRLFRDRDYEAKFQQNRYRLYQLAYMFLAAVATMIGALMALSFTWNPAIVPVLAFVETVIALMTTYLATISGREPPLPLWLSNRRRAEHLRREYFRYLMDLPPYDELEGFERKRVLSLRAANINRGFFPDADRDE